ncbi:enoyl-CoA hydratase [Desertihabitans brevis]|uniref:Enoyl-CoA hydratase n=1 Tax=Desertihabitans brevis TaxID=2268447 RepID=A0A367YSU4_9ACTN|nr:enoyl-CoA hydratase-related protein [Desertihabitans brevis]RCK68956.1 enoyl-CoA hydratase [Desertihabitans brevis]
MTGEVLVRRDQDVVTVTLSHPGKRNAITYAMYEAMERTWDALEADGSVRAVVLRGADGAFAGGTDIRHLADIGDGERGVVYEAMIARGQRGLLRLRVPVVAVVDGACVGGGLVLAALSDLVLCTPGSRFGSPIAQTLGNTLSATSLARLHALLGRRLTSEILMTGRLLSAEEALAAGFVNAVLPTEQLEQRLQELLAAVRRCAPLSLWSFKELERRVDEVHAAVETADVYRRVYGSRDFSEGVESFLAKRPARFQGR